MGNKFATPGSFKPGNKLASKENRPARGIDNLCVTSLIGLLQHATPPKNATRAQIEAAKRNIDKINQKLIEMAISGDKWAMEYIYNRVDGKMPDVVVPLVPAGMPATSDLGYVPGDNAKLINSSTLDSMNDNEISAIYTESVRTP